jgi:Flp pilus assembly protein TadD
MYSQEQLKKIFYGLLIVLFIVFLFLTPHYGISGDEVSQWNYGKSVWNYLKTFGGDKTAVTGTYLENTQTLYGGFFDGVAAMLIDLFHPKDEFLVRHYWNMIFGFAGIVFCGLLAKEFAGWRAAIITVVFLVFTPRFFGEMFNNPKDIPFATGYAASLLCIVKWLKNLERLSWKTTIWLGLSIALAISIRVGGILIIGYLGIFWLLEMIRIKGFEKKLLGKSIKHGLVALVIGWLGACLFWPYALEDIFSHPIEAIKVMSAYPLTIKTLYGGEIIWTATPDPTNIGADGKAALIPGIPLGYLPTWIMMGMPLFILAGLAGAIAFTTRWIKTPSRNYYLLLWFAALFPVLYIMYKRSVVYDGMRHIMFVLPVMVVLAALFFNELLEMFSGKKMVKYAVVAIMAILIALPARFTFANFPNNYVYFNELKGGIKGAYGNYETDYYFNSLKGAFDWLAANKLKGAKPRAGEDSITVASNIPALMEEYVKLSSLPIKFVYVRYYQRGESDWDYGIFVSRFLDKEQLQNGYFPGDNPLHVISVDGVPLTTILENDPQRNAFKGSEAAKAGNDSLAVQYLTAAVKKYPHDAESWRNLAVSAFKTGNKQLAVEAAGKAYAISALDMNNANTAGMIYLQSGDNTKAIQVFGKMTEDYPGDASAWMGLGQAQGAAKNYPLAIEDINKAMSLDQRYTPQGYMILAYIYQQMGDMAQAQKYAQAAQQAGAR